MNLTPELKFIQKKLVLAAHPGLSLEEALNKELVFGSIIILRYNSEKYNYNGGDPDFDTTIEESIFYYLDHEYCFDFNNGIHDYASSTRNPHGTVCIDGKICEITDIIGLPPTLARVLNGLGDATCYDVYTQSIYGINDRYERSTICNRKLLNDDGYDALLWDQSPETITDIAREMGYKSE